MKVRVRCGSVVSCSALTFVRCRQFWPIHSQTCKRDIKSASRLSGRPPSHTKYPYADVGVFTTRIAVDPLPPVSIDHMPASYAFGETYDYIVDGLYANHVAGVSLMYSLTYMAAIECGTLILVFLDHFDILPINVSPTPVPGGGHLQLADCFETGRVYRSFIIWYDKHLHFLDSPLHVYYCSDGYEGQYNPNRALIHLTQTVDILLRRPWYGSVVIVKFASRECTAYAALNFSDIVHVRDYFAYFA